MKILTILITLCMITSPALTQSRKSDTEIQQQILEELRAIHHDLYMNTSVELLLAELQLAQTSLDQAMQRRDKLAGEEGQLQVSERSMRGDVDRFENLASQATNADKKAESTDQLNFLRGELQKIILEEQRIAEQLQDAENRVRTTRTQMEAVQSQLGAAMKSLSWAK